MVARILKLRENTTRVVIVLDYAWRVFSDAMDIPFIGGQYQQGEWKKEKLESLVESAGPPGQVIHRLMDERKISSPDNLLYLGDIILLDGQGRCGQGTDAMNQLYEQTDKGIDVSLLSSHKVSRIRPQINGKKFYEYLVGEVVSDPGRGFFANARKRCGKYRLSEFGSVDLVAATSIYWEFLE